MHSKAFGPCQIFPITLFLALDMRQGSSNIHKIVYVFANAAASKDQVVIDPYLRQSSMPSEHNLAGENRLTRFPFR